MFYQENWKIGGSCFVVELVPCLPPVRRIMCGPAIPSLPSGSSICSLLLWARWTLVQQRDPGPQHLQAALISKVRGNKEGCGFQSAKVLQHLLWGSLQRQRWSRKQPCGDCLASSHDCVSQFLIIHSYRHIFFMVKTRVRPPLCLLPGYCGQWGMLGPGIGALSLRRVRYVALDVSHKEEGEAAS